MDRVKEKILLAIVIVGVYFIFHLVGVGCPIKFFTGAACPGCGMTRAYGELLKLDFLKAFYYHPLFWSVPIMALLFLLKDVINAKKMKIMTYIILIMFIIVYLLRLVSGEYRDVVSIDFRQGFIYRIWDQTLK